jgi:hypothetical protein
MDGRDELMILGISLQRFTACHCSL